ERLVLVLAVELNETGRQILKGAGGGQRPIDKRAAPSLRRDLPADQQLFPAVFEDGLDRRGLFTRSDQIAGGATAKEQSDRLDEYRLPRAGLAGQDVEAGVELHLDRVDDREMLNAQEAEHGKSARTPIVA